MNRSWKWVAAGLAVLLAASPGWGVPVIGHDAIAVAAKSQPLGVRATVRDAAARVESVSLFYAASRGMTPFRVSMSRSGAGMWYGTVSYTHVDVYKRQDKAACLFESVRRGDGQAHSVDGTLDTIMAGLACGDPSPLAWNILDRCADFFLSCPDFIAAKGMRVYAVPVLSLIHI